MNARVSAGRPSDGIRLTRVIGLTIATATLAVGLAACQTPTETNSAQPEARRAAPAAPGVDLSRPADRIEEDIERLRSQRSAEFDRRPADPRGFVVGCRQYVLVEHGAGWRVACVAQPRG
jgi:hypothetical protein